MGRVRRWRYAIAAVAVAVILAAAALALGSGSDEHVPGGFAGFDPEVSAWSPDGSTVADGGARRIVLRGIDGSSRALSGPGIYYFGFPCECRLGWNVAGSEVLFVSHHGEIEGDSVVGRVGTDGSGLESRELGIPVGAAAWSPRGWPLVYVPNERTISAAGRVGPTPDLWILDRLHGKPRRLLAESGEESDPVFSPDGRQILYVRDRRRNDALWEIGVDGSHPHPVAEQLVGPFAASWSPDGSRIALAAVSNRDRRIHLYLMNADGTHRREVVDEEILPDRPAWRPDGSSIAFSNYDGQIREIAIPSGKITTRATLSGQEVTGLEWSPDGRRLGYFAHPVHVEG
jgi:Tol biopolymer transport system component